MTRALKNAVLQQQMINVDKALQILDEETPPVVVDKDKLKVWDTICVVCADNEEKKRTKLLNCRFLSLSPSIYIYIYILFCHFFNKNNYPITALGA